MFACCCTARFDASATRNSSAVADQLLSEDENPAARVPKPRRLRSARMPLPDSRLNAIGSEAGSTGNDPALDSLIIRLRWQPVSPTLMTHLLAHAESRGGLRSGERLLRYPDGTAITSRRYDHLWKRLGEHLPWVETQHVSTHWIRHTVLTWVERRFGFAVAEAYAGHDGSNRGGRAMGATGRCRSRRPGTCPASMTGSVLTRASWPFVPLSSSLRSKSGYRTDRGDCLQVEVVRLQVAARIDPQLHPGHVPGLVGGQEQHRVANIDRLDPRDRHPLLHVER
jgi:hypothetical protein